VLAATALYIAAKTGITIGVGLTSVILAFALYRGLNKANFATDFTILENNCTQSIATAAGYMVSPMIAGLTAYMLVTGKVVPWWHLMVWMCITSILGVLVAFPMKRRFVNEEQLPFPEGRACGVVLDALYTGAATAGMFKARLLGLTALGTAIYQFIISDGWMKLAQFKVLRMHQWLGMKEPWTFHERIDSYYYAASSYVPRIHRLLGLAPHRRHNGHLVGRSRERRVRGAAPDRGSMLVWRLRRRRCADIRGTSLRRGAAGDSPPLPDGRRRPPHRANAADGPRESGARTPRQFPAPTPSR